MDSTSPRRRPSSSRWPTAATILGRSTRSTELVERGVVVAAGSRYMAGGQQIGGPRLKRLLSRMAGRSLHLFASIGTRDATNSFKAYNADFVREVDDPVPRRIRDRPGTRRRRRAARGCRSPSFRPSGSTAREGQSNFQLQKWIPKYLRWYFFAFGRPLAINEIQTGRGIRLEGKQANGEGPRHRIRRIHRRLRRRGAAAPGLQGRRRGQLLEVRSGQEVVRRQPQLRAGRRRRDSTSRG